MSKNSLPHCIGFIMDGNRRYAKERNEPTLQGHQAGAEVFLQIIEKVNEWGIKHAVFYAFSTENWRRSQGEVKYLMELFLNSFTRAADNQALRFKIIGRREDFSSELQTKISNLETETATNSGSTIWVALSYGGRAEILQAIAKVTRVGEVLTEATFSDYLWTKDMPDPDLIIRTGGEQRLSNFLLWQAAYSELFFTDTYWPAFTEQELASILKEYEQRQRRHGR